MTEQDRSILRVCAQTSVDIMRGAVSLQPYTREQVFGLRITDMLMEEPKVWGADDTDL